MAGNLGMTAYDLMDALYDTGDDVTDEDYTFERSFSTREAQCSHYCTFLVDYDWPDFGILPTPGTFDIDSTVEFHKGELTASWKIKLYDDLDSVDYDTFSNNITSDTDEISDPAAGITNEVHVSDYYRNGDTVMTPPDSLNPREMSEAEKSAMGVKKLNKNEAEMFKNNTSIANPSIESATEAPGPIYVAENFPIIAQRTDK